jgi:hypothetical protein
MSVIDSRLYGYELSQYCTASRLIPQFPEHGYSTRLKPNIVRRILAWSDLTVHRTGQARQQRLRARRDDER